jgi:FMN phosphatase YigB (HAD superfamily)
MPDLKAIFFDIDDTLFSTSEFANKARENAVEAMRSRR